MITVVITDSISPTNLRILSNAVQVHAVSMADKTISYFVDALRKKDNPFYREARLPLDA